MYYLYVIGFNFVVFIYGIGWRHKPIPQYELK